VLADPIGESVFGHGSFRPRQQGGDRLGQYSIRINDQYRVCFTWEDGYADEVQVTDYH
jgi:proteic killer suppression protein